MLCIDMNILILIALNSTEYDSSEPSNTPCEGKAAICFVHCCELLCIPAIKCEMLSSLLRSAAVLSTDQNLKTSLSASPRCLKQYKGTSRTARN
jgi:hypothetical protein